MNYKAIIFTGLLIPCFALSNKDDNAQLKESIELKNEKEKPLNSIINNHMQPSKVTNSVASKNITDRFDNNRDATTKALKEISKKIEEIGKLADATKILNSNEDKTDYKIQIPIAETQKLIAQEQAKYLKAKQEFRECLMNNTKSERNTLGIPCGCEELAFKFAIHGGKAEIEDIINTFTQCYPQN